MLLHYEGRPCWINGQFTDAHTFLKAAEQHKPHEYHTEYGNATSCFTMPQVLIRQCSDTISLKQNLFTCRDGRMDRSKQSINCVRCITTDNGGSEKPRGWLPVSGNLARLHPLSWPHPYHAQLHSLTRERLSRKQEASSQWYTHKITVIAAWNHKKLHDWFLQICA